MTTLNKEILSQIFRSGFKHIIDEGTNGHPSSLSSLGYVDNSIYDACWYVGELFNEDDTYVYKNFYIPELNEFINKYENNNEIVEEYYGFKNKQNSESTSISCEDFIQVLFDVEFSGSEDIRNVYHEIYNMYEYMNGACSRLIDNILKHAYNRSKNIKETSEVVQKTNN